MSLPTLEVFGAADVREPQYFNGRLLSAELLNAERAARLARDRRLGRALGPGIATGLEVALVNATAAQPVVRIAPGLAVSANGGVVELAAETDFALARPPAAGTLAGGGFEDCHPPTAEPSNVGAFLLVVGPARREEGRAPVSGIGNLPAPCNVRDAIEGVRLRLVALPSNDDAFPAPGSAERTDPARFALAVQKLRHRLAWRCLGLGAQALAQYLGDPLHATVLDYGELAVADPDCFSADEVPLALICWLEEGLQFVDMWAVRRRIMQPEAGPRFAPLMGDRRLAEAEAALQQFQDQLATLTGPQARQVEARSLFRLLPGGGFLPIDPNGFDVPQFFAGLTREAVEGDPAWLRTLVRTSLDLEPIIVPPAGTGAEVVSRVRIFTFSDSPFVFFMRATAPEPEEPSQPSPEPPTPTPVEKGSILAVVELPSRLIFNPQIQGVQ